MDSLTYELYGTYKCDVCGTIGIHEPEIEKHGLIFVCKACTHNVEMIEKLDKEEHERRERVAERVKRDTEISEFKRQLLKQDIFFPSTRLDEAFTLDDGLEVSDAFSLGDCSFERRAYISVRMDKSSEAETPSYEVEVSEHGIRYWRERSDNIYVSFEIYTNGSGFIELVRNPDKIREILKDYNAIIV